MVRAEGGREEAIRLIPQFAAAAFAPVASTPAIWFLIWFGVEMGGALGYYLFATAALVFAAAWKAAFELVKEDW